MIKACIFDLDGVIVDTAKYHFIAWRKLAHNLGIDFTEKHNENLKGVGRIESLKYILDLNGLEFSENELNKLAAAKNNTYLNLIEELDHSEILPGVEDFITDLKNNDIKIALGSSSKNAALILSKLGIDHLFEVTIDGNKTNKTKPDPQVFQLGAEQLNILPENIVVFEDAVKGIEAALNGGFKVIGVGDENELSTANKVIPDFNEINFLGLKNIYQY